MRKQVLLYVLIWCCTGLAAYAQTRQLTGTVISAEEGPLPGVNVVLKGTSIGTTTDAKGKYVMSIPNDAAILTFSSIGFATGEEKVGSRSVLDVTMVSDIRALSEVVVTAFGVKKEVKSLGYGVQEIKGQQLTEARATNVVNGLSGKVAGLRVSSNGGPGSGSTIQIRGASSVSGNNQPLVVIDGVPIQQTFDKQFGSGLAEINPDNIQEMTVLKGPNAAALYGSRAANGVILVTTKTGAGTKGIGVEINTNTTFERPWVKPNFQNTYGGGNGYRTWYNDGWSGSITDPLEISQYRAAYGPNAPLNGTEGTDESWGAPMDGRLVRQWYTGKEVAPLTPQPNNYDEYWATGKTFTNNIALSGGNDKGNFRMSIGRLDQQGIMYYNDFHRNNFKFNSGYNFTPKLNVMLSAEYIKSGSTNRGYTEGQQFIWSHRHVSWDQLRNYEAYQDISINRAVPGKPADTDPPNWQHTFFTNPYFTQKELPFGNDKDRLVGNIALNYKILPSLSLLLRSGTDVWTDTRINVLNFERVRNGNTTPGSYSEEILRRQESNSDFIFTFNKNITSDFSLNAQAGGISRSNYYKRNFLRVGQLVVDGVYNAGNANPSQNTAESAIEKSQVNSAFGSVELGWRNALFLNGTARNDWSSTLPAEARSYFYPSVSVSAVLSELFNVQSSVLSFAKVRASWAQVGNDADPYQLLQTFRANGSWNGSVPEFFENKKIANSGLKPEITTGTELGLDLRFLKGRIGLDITYYDQLSRNQILGVEISKASGYDSRILNAGKISNKGMEIVLTGSPVRLNGFTWETTLNFSRNRNKVLELAEGLTTYVLYSRQGLNSEARVGQPYGTLYGIGFEHAPDGQVIYGANGYPVVSSTPRALGNIQPKWTGGWQNSFSYKGIVVSALVDIRSGGNLFDEGTGTARWTGQYAETGIGREEGIIGKGVVKVGTVEQPTYIPNTTIVPASALYGYNNPRRYHEAAIFDASYVKLREVTLGYQIPPALLSRIKVRSAKISLVGRNVLMLFKNTPHIDPEADRFGSNSQGFAYGELPSSRSMGVNLNLSF
ncbi:SusC/RagA family TonB-linked outer membrane protein [Spirosoma utsteinense]|uniref:TonB-linked SusC/RagA family outer membrane protein n=1 Tax=Spirosoma utsteinense TaxID=2585773 RepID=A0ABR6WAQ3_9BACT|nr:SusC/RagA family TonB-linked outer membrane protein [Spirosoma utsteinense]MBC3787861.1 TonB-linked SusC/RagA family outer membrane protein [Spirosoma utsteinense]MBC3793649.1 TonB-linked SusC/RagA family outer membrane protein [Spirosoma utsteinense]